MGGGLDCLLGKAVPVPCSCVLVVVVVVVVCVCVCVGGGGGLSFCAQFYMQTARHTGHGRVSFWTLVGLVAM